MTIKIAYLGWGSLLWNFKDLKIDSWIQSNLSFPLEFSRISKDGRLTLVVDEKIGTPNLIWYALANYKNVDTAINDLKKREGTLKKNISYVNLAKKKYRIKNTSPKLGQEIVMWALKEKVDVVIWTDLLTNWEEIRKVPYSSKNAIEYFEESSITTQMKIFDYVYGANKIGKIKTNFSIDFFKFLEKYLKNMMQ